ncbi:MAG: hypothetical protein IJM91_01050 [Lachnospiraceae bacterium]|nr:hypothetical protein [Lachnospiraceae bacterium]
MKAFVKLSLKYPEIVFAERWNLFLEGAGITGKTVTNFERTYALFDPQNINSAAKAVKHKGWKYYNPLSKSARKYCICLLCARRMDGSPKGIILRLIWNAIIPMLVIVYAWLRQLVKKDWLLFLLCTSIICKMLIVVLTQPDSWFMYYLSFYLMGYVFGFYAIMRFIQTKLGIQRKVL